MTTRPDSAPTNGADAPRALVVGVPAETLDGERRVALTPAVVPALAKLGADVVVESGAGVPAGFRDAVWERAWDVLNAPEPLPGFEHLGHDERSAITSIVKATVEGLPACWD